MAINLTSTGFSRVMKREGSFFAGIGRSLSTSMLQAFPVLIVALFVGCVLLAVAAHDEQTERLRELETERVLNDFESEPVASAWARLTEAWEAEGDRQQALIDRAGRDGIEPGAGAIVSRDHQLLVLETVAEYELADDIDIVLRYFQRLAFCIRVGACDGEVMATYFGKVPWQFRNQHYPHLVDTYPNEPFDEWIATVAPPGPRIPAVVF